MLVEDYWWGARESIQPHHVVIKCHALYQLLCQMPLLKRNVDSDIRKRLAQLPWSWSDPESYKSPTRILSGSKIP